MKLENKMINYVIHLTCETERSSIETNTIESVKYIDHISQITKLVSVLMRIPSMRVVSFLCLYVVFLEQLLNLHLHPPLIKQKSSFDLWPFKLSMKIIL